MDIAQSFYLFLGQTFLDQPLFHFGNFGGMNFPEQAGKPCLQLFGVPAGVEILDDPLQDFQPLFLSRSSDMTIPPFPPGSFSYLPVVRRSSPVCLFPSAP